MEEWSGPRIIVQVWRFTPGEETGGRFEEFGIPSAEPLSVMALLGRIHAVDPEFGCRTSLCYKGKCGSCLVRVNGQDVFGCTTLVQPGEMVQVEPHSKYRVLRDVAVDFSALREA